MSSPHPPQGAPVTMQRLEREVHALRQTLDGAAETLGAYEAEIAPIRDRYAPRIRRHAAEIAARKRGIGELIAAGVQLFRRPKSRVIHGIKIGVRKAADRWAWPDDAALVELIRARCTPEQQEAYLVTTTVGRKDAIPEAVRAELGIGCTPGADSPVVDEQAPGTGAAVLALLSQIPEEAP